MTLSMYAASAPVFAKTLTNLAAILAKAEAFAAAKGIDPSVLVQARLYPDMFPLARQVHIATNAAKGAAARLAGADNPGFPETETTLAQLGERCAQTIAFLEQFSPDQIDGSEDREIVLALGGAPKRYTGAPYLLEFALPTFYFHVTMAYAILRHNGLDIGKDDFITPPQ